MNEFETWRDQFRNEAIVPIQNKVGQFLNTSFIRNIVGQPKSTLNIPEIMNTGKILLVNVSKGKIGEDNSALLGAMIITKLQLTAMERVRIAEDDRVDFYLYVDEFQNFATDSFASILSEARKYRLDLTLAHQYIGQLVTDVSTKVRDAVFGNVGTMICFRVGATDAEYMEKEFEPEFVIQDIVNLPNYHIYLKLMVDGVNSRPFSAVTLPPLKFEVSAENYQEIINVSRERYARPRVEVEEAITHWSGMGGMDVGGGAEVAEKKLTEAVCWNCGKTATVPFKPDGKRPVYCLDCLKKIEAGTLIPLPERMPQVGRSKFAGSLGDIGIEFAPGANPLPARPAGGPAGSQAPAPGAPMRDHGNEPPNRPRQNQNPADTRPPVRRESSRGEWRRDGRQTDNRPDSRPEPRRFPPVSPGPRFTTQPVLRNQGEKQVSLGNLKPREPREEKSGHPNNQAGAGHRPTINVSELRKVLEESLRPSVERGEDKKESSRGAGDSGANGSVVKPGEAVKF